LPVSILYPNLQVGRSNNASHIQAWFIGCALNRPKSGSHETRPLLTPHQQTHEHHVSLLITELSEPLQDHLNNTTQP